MFDNCQVNSLHPYWLEHKLIFYVSNHLLDLFTYTLYQMYLVQEIVLADLFMLFIFTEILAMVAAFYSSKRIPVTLPIIIAITALCRLIVMQNKDMDALIIIAEASAVIILAGAAYIMSLKDKISLEKLQDRER